MLTCPARNPRFSGVRLCLGVLALRYRQQLWRMRIHFLTLRQVAWEVMRFVIVPCLVGNRCHLRMCWRSISCVLLDSIVSFWRRLGYMRVSWNSQCFHSHLSRVSFWSPVFLDPLLQLRRPSPCGEPYDGLAGHVDGNGHCISSRCYFHLCGSEHDDEDAQIWRMICRNPGGCN